MVAPGQNTSVRLDQYITMMVENATRNKVQEGIKSGWVRVNGADCKASYKVQPNDVIDIVLPKPPPPEAEPEDIPLKIIYEDDDLLIVDKEAGMVVHPAYGNWTGTLVNAVMHHVGELEEWDDDDEQARLRPGIVHRLDKDTTGLMVVAKNDSTLSRLSGQFKKRTIKRRYWALVWGETPEEGTWSGNIGRSRRDRKVMTVVPGPEGKHAVTHFKTLEVFGDVSLLELRLETGRTHQIRVHCAHFGHPVLGDPTYGGDSVRYGSNTGSRKQFFENVFKLLGRQCLHAKTLGFVHPTSGEFMEFESELPEDFHTVLEKLNNRNYGA